MTLHQCVNPLVLFLATFVGDNVKYFHTLEKAIIEGLTLCSPRE